MSLQNFRVVCGVAQNELMIAILAKQSNADFEILLGRRAESLLSHFLVSGWLVSWCGAALHEYKYIRTAFTVKPFPHILSEHKQEDS